MFCSVTPSAAIVKPTPTSGSSRGGTWTTVPLPSGPAPLIVTDLSTSTFSTKLPASTFTVSPSEAASMPPWMLESVSVEPGVCVPGAVT